MEIQEFNIKIAQSENKEFYDKLEVLLNYPQINFNSNIQGLSAIYEFINRQIQGFNTLGSLPPEFADIKRVFENAKNETIRLFNGNITYQNDWNNVFNQLRGNNPRIFLYDSPETEFLIRLYKEKQESYAGAIEYFNGQTQNNSNKHYFIGYLMAYELQSKQFSEIADRKSKEKTSIVRLRTDFQKLFEETDRNVTDYINKTHEKFNNYSNLIDKLKEEKNILFQEWFETEKNNFTLFHGSAEQKMLNLEKTYQEQLRLKKPAEYWNKRAGEMKKEGKYFLKWMVGLLAFACVTLYFLLWLTPSGMLLSFIKGDASAIKWSLVYITFISFLVFGIRALSKAMFSSFHLARDAEEREQLTYFYLSLLNDSSVDEKDRSLIMQSLFSRSDTGLLKEDSSPTMPGNVAEKFMK
ncbi:MAG: DUF6161 domain-containing protein [Sediminibacterium sp.]|nr:DUF6161 domain-containing protein [Sediminibacterium sp.]